jgi:RHS repeat-associated protein
MKTLTNLHRYGRRDLFATALGLLLCAVVVTLTVSGQKTKDKPDQNLKSMARVNPSTLAMEFSLPIFSYPGRGGNGLSLALNYSSKLWTMERGNYHTDSNYISAYPSHTEVQLTNNLLAKFSFRKIAGWTSSLRPPVLLENVDLYNQSGYDFPSSVETVGEQATEDHCDTTDHGIVTYPSCPSGLAREIITECCPANGPHPCSAPVTTYNIECIPMPINVNGGSAGAPDSVHTRDPQFPKLVPRTRILMPDGSTHEFRKSDRIYSCLPEYPNGPSDDCNDTNGTYLSVDGSGMRLERGERQENHETRDVLYVPDGSRYVFSPTGESTSTTFERKAERFVDAHGNQMTYDINDQTWTDTMGQEIVDPLQNSLAIASMAEGGQEIEVPGLAGGTPSTYEVVWGKLKPETCENDSSNCSGNILEDIDVYGTPNYELSYVGDDECQGIGDTPKSPALFASDEPISVWGLGQNSNTVYKTVQRVCSTFTGTSRRFNPIVLARLNLPNGTHYEFKYNRYGEITRITYPTGAFERFRYDKIPVLGAVSPNPVYEQANRGVKERWVSFDGSTVAQHWQYESYGDVIVTTAPDGTKTRSKLFTSGVESRFGLDDPRIGMPVEVDVYSSSCTATGDPVTACAADLMRRTLTEWIVEAPRTDGDSRATRDARVARTISIVFEPSSGGALATMTENTYDDSNTDELYFAHLNVVGSKQYNYVGLGLSTAQTGTLTDVAGSFASVNPFQRTETQYRYDGDYQARNLHSLPVETRTFGRKPSDGTEYLVAATQVEYDEGESVSYGVTPSTWEDPGAAKRGLVTSSKACSAISGTACTAWIETRTQYDQFGNPAYQWDAKQIAANHTGTQYATHTEYSDSTHDYKYSFPFRVTTPAPDPSGTTGSSSGFVTSSTYDLNTGLVLTSTDANGKTTTMEYNDPLLRPTKSIPPSGGGKTETVYDDTPGQVSVKVRTQIDESRWGEITTFADKAGRVYKTVAKDSQGDVTVETEYDSLGRVHRVTNPYRSGETKLWTRTEYDERGRVIEVFAPTATGQTPASSVTNAYGISLITNYLGTYATGTDEAGKTGRSITNALGQVIRVDEATGSNALGTLASPNQPTFYSYSGSGQMVKVQQGSQYRYFLYDPLGRLLRVRQPEVDTNSTLQLSDSLTGNADWTAASTFDANGNVLTTTDAKGVVTTNAYDQAGRPISRTYTLPTTTDPKKVVFATPNVFYKYDGVGTSIPNALGQLTEITNGISTNRQTGFDNLGHLISSEQITDGVTYTSTYKYSLSGALLEEKYPSGRVMKNTYDSTGNLLRIFGHGANRADQNYAMDFKHTSWGVLSQIHLGNNLWENAQFNPREQLTELALGTSPTDVSRWKLGYEYGEFDTNGTLQTSRNNGNFARQTLSFTGAAYPYVQTFQYDALSRVLQTKETVNGQQNWLQTFTYDRYGNRTGFSQNIGGQQLTIDSQTLPDVDPATNRFTTGQGYEYDYCGNLITDAQNRHFSFNADNKQAEVRNSSNYLIGQYFYDAGGKRVKKTAGSETTIFVYDGMGKQIAEYSTTAVSNPTTSYVMTDTLQSVRAVSDAQGNIISRRDFLPFGEELFSGTANRTATQGYSAIGADNIRKRFTGYEKDVETGLDFAEARYYNNQHGRFTAVDPLLASGKSANPQSFNRYSYVMNSPLRMTDHSGLQAGSSSEEFADTIGYLRIDAGEYYEPRFEGARVDTLPDWSTQTQAFNDMRQRQIGANLNGSQVWVGFKMGLKEAANGPFTTPLSSYIFTPAISHFAGTAGIAGPSFADLSGIQPFPTQHAANPSQSIGMGTAQLTVILGTAAISKGVGFRFSFGTAGEAEAGLIGVPEASLTRMTARVNGINIGGNKVFSNIEAFGSRAGSTFRGRGPLPASDLDIMLTSRRPLYTFNARSQAHIRSRLGQIGSDFSSETGFPVNFTFDTARPSLSGPFIPLR